MTYCFRSEYVGPSDQSRVTGSFISPGVPPPPLTNTWEQKAEYTKVAFSRFYCWHVTRPWQLGGDLFARQSASVSSCKKKPNRDTLDRLAPGKPLVLFPHIIFACMSRHTRFFCQLCLSVSHVCHALLQVCMLVTMQVPYSQELCYRNNLPYRHAHTNIPKVFHAILKCGCNCCQ